MAAFTGDLMSISDKLSRIKKGATELNAKTDTLNATIEHIEKELLGTGVTFWWWNYRLCEDRFRGDDDVPQRTYFILGYAKIANEWCIGVREIEDTAVDERLDDWESFEGDPVPLKRAARRVRIEAAAALEDFLDALSNEVVRMSAAVDKANALVTAEERFEAALLAPGPRAGFDEEAFQRSMRSPSNPTKKGGK